MSEKVDYNEIMYDKAESLLRVHGILSIIFGALGTLISSLVLLAGIIAIVTGGSMYQTAEDAAVWVFIFVFVLLPHIFMLVAGIVFLRHPVPKVAKGLVITNLVLGIFWNLVILIFAIINLTQISDYERGYKKVKS